MAKYDAHAFFFLQFWLYRFPYVSARVSYVGVLGCPTWVSARVSLWVLGCPTWVSARVSLWVPRGLRMGPVGYEKHWRFPCGAHTVPVWGTCGVLRIIRPNHKCTAVSSCTGPVAWCDHENSTEVKILRALHSALLAKNRTGDENRTGPWLDVTEALRHLQVEWLPILVPAYESWIVSWY